MTKRIAFSFVFLVLGVLVACSCRRSELNTVSIDVPGMSGSESIRIVTNAALDEVVGQYDGIKNEYEIDLARKVVLYHESQRLLNPDYQHQIEARIAEVGFSAKVMKTGLNPPPPVPTIDGPVQIWPNRFTAVLSVPNMISTADANVVVDAIAYARLGRDDPRISVNATTRRLVIEYESLHLSQKNIEYAIACVGYDANDVPARMGYTDALPHGWTPVQL